VLAVAFGLKAFGLSLPLELSIATQLEAGSHAYTYNP
jgi:hypothetical protein